MFPASAYVSYYRPEIQARSVIVIRGLGALVDGFAPME
jgi:hypothetical protein